MGEVIAIVAVSSVAACGLILCLTACGVMVIRTLRGGSRDHDGNVEMGVDESQLMQQLHAGMMRMESRVEPLETILMDRIDRKETADVESGRS